jgi:hypothetical protein
VNEVKDICERMLAVPAPPMREGAEVLASARRAAVRRDRARLIGSGVAGVAAVAAAAALIVPAGAGRGPTPVPPAASAPSTPVSRVPAEVPAVPPPLARAASTHDRQMYQLLAGALPAGYTARSTYPFSDDDTVYPTNPERAPDGSHHMLAHAFVTVSAGGGEGQLFAFITNDGKPVPSGDLCAPVVTTPATPNDTCAVMTINGVQVRVTTSWDAEHGHETVATRFLRFGRLDVVAWQGVPSYEPDTKLPPDANRAPRSQADEDRKPPLSAPLLDAPTVAALAANPAMLQFP